MQNHYFNDTHPHRPYTHSTEASEGTVAPLNALRGDQPVIKPGFWPCEKDGQWVDVENNKGKQGYLNGELHEIKELGPLPDGWSDTPPPPTVEELFERLRAARDARLADTDKYLLPDYPVNADSLAAIKAYRQALRDLPDQDGAPWDGGGDATPWPELPSVE